MAGADLPSILVDRICRCQVNSNAELLPEHVVDDLLSLVWLEIVLAARQLLIINHLGKQGYRL